MWEVLERSDGKDTDLLQSGPWSTQLLQEQLSVLCWVWVRHGQGTGPPGHVLGSPLGDLWEILCFFSTVLLVGVSLSQANRSEGGKHKNHHHHLAALNPLLNLLISPGPSFPPFPHSFCTHLQAKGVSHPHPPNQTPPEVPTNLKGSGAASP